MHIQPTETNSQLKIKKKNNSICMPPLAFCTSTYKLTKTANSQSNIINILPVSRKFHTLETDKSWTYIRNENQGVQTSCTPQLFRTY